MNTFGVTSSLLQQSGAGQNGGIGSIVINVGMIVAIIVIFYFLIIRPQSKKQKETENMLSGLKKGDKIESIGGIRGIVQSVKDDAVIVKVDESTKLEFSKRAIASVFSENSGKESKGSEKAKSAKTGESPEENIQKEEK